MACRKLVVRTSFPDPGDVIWRVVFPEPEPIVVKTRLLGVWTNVDPPALAIRVLGFPDPSNVWNESNVRIAAFVVTNPVAAISPPIDNTSPFVPAVDRVRVVLPDGAYAFVKLMTPSDPKYVLESSGAYHRE
jgi:hypothetical protein